MYRELLTRVADEQRGFGSSLQPPATEQQLQELVKAARNDVHAEVPADHVNFLRQSNGLDWNGVVIYATETVPIVGHPERSIPGIVEMNLNFRDDPRFNDLLVLGSNGMDLYTYRIATGLYEVYDEIPHELLDTISTYDQLITRALTRSLQ